MTPEPKRVGRPPSPPEVRSQWKRVRSIRLSDLHWIKLQKLGTDWLERAIDRAK